MSEADLLNEAFGRYVLERSVARGGMAEIFLARQEGPAGFNRKLVIKRVLPELAHRPKFVALFLDEARLAAQLSHPNIVSIYDFGEENGAYFLAMELVAGPSLRDLGRAAFRSGARLPYEVTARIGAAVAEGLAYAHSLCDESGAPLNIVHRDISPSNVMVSADGVPKIVDFGIAKAANRTHRTRTGEIKGKIAYMPPEQLLGEPIDGRADVYALGVVLYQLVAGKRPYDAPTEFALMQRICSGQATPLRSHDAEVPEALERIIVRAMSSNPEQRYADARELCADLDRFVLAQGSPVSSFDIAEQVRRVQQAYGKPLNRLVELVSVARSLPGEDLERPGPSSTVSMRTATDVPTDPVEQADRRPTIPLAAATAPTAPETPASRVVASSREAPLRKTRRALLLAALGCVLLAASLWWLGRDTGDVPAVEVATTSPELVAENPDAAEQEANERAPAQEEPQAEEQEEAAAAPVAKARRPRVQDAPTPAVAAEPASESAPVARRSPPPLPPPLPPLGASGSATAAGTPAPAAAPPDAAAGAPIATTSADASEVSPARPADPPQRGRMVIGTIPKTEVYLGSSLLGMTPLDIEMRPGSHRITFKNLPQQVQHEEEVRVVAGEVTHRSFDLRPAKITLVVKPWGEVYVDGQLRGTTPMSPLLLSPGAHSIDVVHPESGRRAQRQLSLKSAEARTIKIDLSEAP